jgi:hypothetical protein
MSNAPRCKQLYDSLLGAEDNRIKNKWYCLAMTLEHELNTANKIIADAKEYISEFREFPMEDGLMAILEGRINS